MLLSGLQQEFLPAFSGGSAVRVNSAPVLCRDPESAPRNASLPNGIASVEAVSSDQTRLIAMGAGRERALRAPCLRQSPRRTHSAPLFLQPRAPRAAAPGHVVGRTGPLLVRVAADMRARLRHLDAHGEAVVRRVVRRQPVDDVTARGQWLPGAGHRRVRLAIWSTYAFVHVWG
jgi:hypothetical protein